MYMHTSLRKAEGKPASYLNGKIEGTKQVNTIAT